MLKSIDGSRINRIPHREDFDAVARRLGVDRIEAVRAYLDRIIDEIERDNETGRRTFSSSFLGSQLTPWPQPLASLYDVSREILGQDTEERHVQDRAALIFGLFIWECIMNRDEEWVFYDPNLSTNDPNREITGKVYFEQDC